MRVSCIPVCFFREFYAGEMSMGDWIVMAAEIGLDGIEVYRPFVKDPSPDGLRRLADEIASAGLAISMFTSYGQLAVPPGPEQDEQVASIKNDVDMAAALGVDIVRMTSGDRPDDCEQEEVLRRVADCLRLGLDHAEERGVMIAFEDHPGIGTSIEEFTRILDLVGDDRLKVNLDMSNPMASGDSSADLVGLVLDRIVHVHASDRSADLEHQVTGEGVVPYPEVFGVLKASGYDGWISLESGGTTGKQGIIQAMEFVKRVWAEA